VLRDGMAADSLEPVGIYFGTRSGKLFASKDEGRSWKKILEGLPSIVCVKSVVVELDGAPAPKVRAKVASRKAARSRGRNRRAKRK
jgi:hypothetical protein